jgi:inorganic pyrophosphatase/exopolyphosphatase
MRKSLIALVFLIFASCQSSKDQIAILVSHIWIWNEGRDIGGEIQFDTIHRKSNAMVFIVDDKMNIYQNDVRVAKIIKIDCNSFSLRDTNNEEGRYIAIVDK